jgi:cytochrome c oxidase subunit 1
VVVYSGVLIGVVGWGVWAHHMFSVGLGPIADSVFSASTMLIAVPTGVKIFNWIATMWGGRLEFRTPMLFAIGFVSMFVIGGLSGVMHASPPADLQQTDTYFVVAHFHYVLFGGAVQGLFGGMYYWWPKVFGRALNDRIGKLHFWLMFLGLNLTFFPMHFSGLLGMPRRIYTYGAGLGLDTFNLISTIGAVVTGVATLVFVYNVWASRRTVLREANPWQAATLEWSTASPPAVYNFAVIPEVHSRLPLWAPDGVTPRSQPATPPERVHVPGGSIWPLFTAVGILIMAVGALMHQAFVPSLATALVGAAVTVVSIYRWAFEPFEV